MFRPFHYEAQYSFRPSAPRMTQAVQRLIIANLLVFVAQLFLDIPFGAPVSRTRALGGPPGGILLDWFAFQYGFFFRGGVWTPFTYMFVHGGLLHLFVNMLMLYVFGPGVERLLSTRQFYRFYVICGAAGVFASLLGALFGNFFPHLVGPPRLIIGASGAVMGVLVAFAMAYPEEEFIFFPLPMTVTARGVVVLMILLNLIYVFARTNISVSTHFGGMLVGFAYMKLVPLLRDWYAARQRRRAEDKLEAIGRAVDNIFRFDEEKRRRHY